VGEQERDAQLNAVVRAGIGRMRGGFESLARAARERGEAGPAVEPRDVATIAVSLLQGLLIQLSVFGDELDVDAYASAAAALLDS
jgi:hypothetical protein